MNWDSLCRHADRFLFRQLITRQIRACPKPQAEPTTLINGVNTERLEVMVQAIQQTPVLAQARLRATSRWIGGGQTQSLLQGFYGAGQEDTTRTQPFVLDADEPQVLLGRDQAPKPEEFVLHALAACLTTSLVYHASARGIRIESVESTLEGDLDLQGFLGLSDTVRRGYTQIRVRFTIKSDAPAEQLQELTNFSPVLDIISNPVPVSIAITTAPTSYTQGRIQDGCSLSGENVVMSAGDEQEHGRRRSNYLEREDDQ